MTDNIIRILAVDDEILNLEIIEHTLAKAGYHVTCVTDGGQALVALNGNPHGFDLVLLDRMMPVMNGMEVLHRIKKTPQLHNLPVIMQTAASQVEQIQEGLKAGAYYYLTKPFSKELLLEVVSKAANDILLTRSIKQHGHDTQHEYLEEYAYEIQTDIEAEHLALYIGSEYHFSDADITALEHTFVQMIALLNLPEKPVLTADIPSLRNALANYLAAGGAELGTLQARIQILENEIKVRLTAIGAQPISAFADAVISRAEATKTEGINKVEHDANEQAITLRLHHKKQTSSTQSDTGNPQPMRKAEGW